MYRSTRLLTAHFLLGLALSILFASGCKQLSNPQNEEPLTEQGNSQLVASSDLSEYTGGNIMLVTIRNQTGSTAHFTHCGGQIAFFIEHIDNSDWVEKGSRGMPCPAIFEMGVIPLSADAAYNDTVMLPEPGTYRLLYPYDWEDGATWTHTLMSNTFTVR